MRTEGRAADVVREEGLGERRVGDVVVDAVVDVLLLARRALADGVRLNVWVSVSVLIGSGKCSPEFCRIGVNVDCFGSAVNP